MKIRKIHLTCDASSIIRNQIKVKSLAHQVFGEDTKVTQVNSPNEWDFSWRIETPHIDKLEAFRKVMASQNTVVKHLHSIKSDFH